jgi:hypothetical protein
MNIRSKVFGGGKLPEELILKAKAPKGAKAEALNSVAVAREESRRSNGRYEDRHRLPDEQVRVTYDGNEHEVQLINLSGGGAMVAGGFAPMLWDRVDLHLGDDGTVECAVRWLRDDRIGLEFAHETRLDCSADEQAALLREVIMRSFPDLHFDAPSELPAQAAVRKQEPEHRTAHRHPLIWVGTLHHDYQSTPVRLRNISSTGAMVETTTPVRLGAEPLLELNEAASVSATVTWVVGDQVGLHFHTPFDMSLLARSRPEVAPTKWVRPSYLQNAAADDSPWDPRWKRLSVGELKEELEGFLKR